MAIKAEKINTMLSNLYIIDRFFKNIPYKANNDKTASSADAKLGLPRVEIIELYGLFHLIKSLPLIWINPYVLKTRPVNNPIL